MKYTLIVFIFLMAFLIISCADNNIIGPSSGRLLPRYVPSDEAREHFLLDATDFAVEKLFLTKSPDTASIFVPEEILNEYLYPLAYLYDNRKSFPLLDTLIVQKNIHNQVSPNGSLIILADTLYDWVRNLKNGITPTGNPIVDSLIELCSLTFEPPIFWGYDSYALFVTIQRPLNVRALGNAFTKAPGVILANPNFRWNNSWKLEVELQWNLARIRFYLGYGDCPSGCFGYERWTFTVSRDYKIKYEGYLLQ